MKPTINLRGYQEQNNGKTKLQKTYNTLLVAISDIEMALFAMQDFATNKDDLENITKLQVNLVNMKKELRNIYHKLNELMEN